MRGGEFLPVFGRDGRVFRGRLVVWWWRGVGWAGGWAGVAVGSLQVGVSGVELRVCGGGALWVRVLGGVGGI